MSMCSIHTDIVIAVDWGTNMIRIHHWQPFHHVWFGLQQQDLLLESASPGVACRMICVAIGSMGNNLCHHTSPSLSHTQSELLATSTFISDHKRNLESDPWDLQIDWLKFNLLWQAGGVGSNSKYKYWQDYAWNSFVKMCVSANNIPNTSDIRQTLNVGIFFNWNMVQCDWCVYWGDIRPRTQLEQKLVQGSLQQGSEGEGFVSGLEVLG